MIPDERLRDLLQSAESASRPDAEFLDGLFADLQKERRARRSWLSKLDLPRPVLYAALAPAVIVIALGGLVLFGGLLAVNPGGVGGPGGTATPTGSPPPSTLPSPSPVPSASVLETGPLEPGRWQFEDFEPRTEFAVADGWLAEVDNPVHARLSTGDAAIGSIDLVRVTSVYADGCFGEPVSMGADPTEFLEWVEAHPLLRSTGTTRVTIGGHAATRIVTTAVSHEGACTTQPTPRVILLSAGDDTLSAMPGETTTFDVIEWEDTLLVVAVNTPTDATDAVIESLVFTPTSALPSPGAS